VSFYDWMLALHVLAAFSVASSLVLFGVIVVSGRRTTTLEEARPHFRLGTVGGVLIGVGMGLALLLGIVLAIDHDDYQLWDVWVIAAIVLWALMGWAGDRSGKYYTAVQKIAESGDPNAESEVLARLRAPTGVRWYLATLGLFVLIALDMIFKPWA
jgi:hypothetical protein